MSTRATRTTRTTMRTTSTATPKQRRCQKYYKRHRRSSKLPSPRPKLAMQPTSAFGKDIHTPSWVKKIRWRLPFARVFLSVSVLNTTKRNLSHSVGTRPFPIAPEGAYTPRSWHLLMELATRPRGMFSVFQTLNIPVFVKVSLADTYTGFR